ncbi:hypothetical protein QE369_003217 [Agrobacterium larrymoorei]|uniref:Uncharacterized protein n=1 Tax=Agrobacterium larrymoorei TaxID=160699 RepID=A0AAJ2BB02_9HYPH|nr:hypothetical protein [Agrobacterium larrymoorei]MDR6103020.1 hypothetical protein [Agrobacterium larrymoorei]
MRKAVKKEPIVSPLHQYKRRFQTIIDAASVFEEHENQSQKLLYVALERLFAFGEDIRQEAQSFESFLEDHAKPLNKVTRENPYNALVELTFSKNTSKSWRSEISNVLRYAAETKVTEPLPTWLEEGKGISGRYGEAVDYYGRKATQKNQRLRSSQLDMISAELTQARIVAAPLPGVTLADGFHRSLLFSEGGKTFLVHVREKDDPKTVDKYLLEAVGSRTPKDHPLAARPLYPLYRAIDLIAGTCKPSNSSQHQVIAIWNEMADGVPVTKLRFLSDAYSFTNATVTLAHSLAELDGKGQYAFELQDAETFRQRFQHDHKWRILVDTKGISVVDDAKSQSRLTLRPIAAYLGKKLRQGSKLGLRTRHFQATCIGMKTSASNLEMATALFKRANGAQLTADPTPKRIQWLLDGAMLEVGFTSAKGYSGLSYPFLEFTAHTAAIDPQMELSLADIAAFWKTASSYGEDLAGYIANSDVADAAFCIDHSFKDGDRFEYVSPMVLGVSMARTQVCEDFSAAPTPPPPPARPSGSKQSTSSETRSRDHARIEKNRRGKTNFPVAPSSSLRAFGAFITSYLPDDAAHRKDRKFDFEWQLEWWRRMTDIPVHVVASNWTDEEVAASKELGLLSEHGGSIIRQPGQSIARNRNLCLSQLYKSDFDWGIVMDDDAVLMQDEHHNSSYRLFAEMAENGLSAYQGVDLFQPIFGRQTPFNTKYSAPNAPYTDNHVFERSTNLKGTMIVVRNFAKEGRDLLFLPEEFDFVGEDTYLTLQAISKGYAPMTCWNIILEELGGKSHFAMTDAKRIEKMREGHQQLVKAFNRDGLRMNSEGSHKLDKSDFTERFWGNKKLTVNVPKSVGKVR